MTDDRSLDNLAKTYRRPVPKPPFYTYEDELGEKVLVANIEESIRLILDDWPNATGETVAGSDGTHRTYWYKSKVVAHTWPTGEDEAIWLCLMQKAL